MSFLADEGMMTRRYRLTGDRKWQEKGWKMFVSWVTTAKVAGGMSSVLDVTKPDGAFGDNMESFLFAETLKWVALLFPRRT